MIPTYIALTPSNRRQDDSPQYVADLHGGTTAHQNLAYRFFSSHSAQHYGIPTPFVSQHDTLCECCLTPQVS